MDNRILHEIAELRRLVIGAREDIAGLRGGLGPIPDAVIRLQRGLGTHVATSAQTTGELRSSVRRLNWLAGTVIGTLITAVVTLLVRGAHAGV